MSRRTRTLDELFERRMSHLQQVKARKNDLLNQGLCTCRKPVEDGHTRCHDCLEYKRNYNKTHKPKD